MAANPNKVTTFKIFVKNLPPGTKSEELKLIFEEFGRVVECQIFRDSLAFLHMEDDLCGKNAVAMLNGRAISGRVIGVEESRQKNQGPSIPSTRLRVLNIPSTLTARDLRSLFTKYGLVLSAEVTNEEGIVIVEAIADVRTAINEVNGFVYGGQTLIVEPLVNTAISYTPKIRAPESPKRYRPPLPSYSHLSSLTSFGSPRIFSGGSPSHHNPEGRVLRDPYAAPPPLPRMVRPPFIKGPRGVQAHSHRPMGPGFTSPRNSSLTVGIEPLFLKRHKILEASPALASEIFYEDESLDIPQEPESFPQFTPNYQVSNGNNLRHPSPMAGKYALRPQSFHRGFPVKRSINVPQPEVGEAFQVPGMIRPGEFRPPKKYFANRPHQPNHKRKRTEPKPQPPIPEQQTRPVPDFSNYYNQLPPGAVLKPFPPPLNADADFSDDVYV